MVKYQILEQKKFYNSHSWYNTYGIIAFENGIHIRTVSDISTNKSHVIALVEKFNLNNLDICHLSAAIEDYLYDLKVD